MKCPQCGMETDGKFCPICGAEVNAAAQSVESAAPQQAAQPVENPAGAPQQPTAQPYAGTAYAPAGAYGTPAPKKWYQSTWFIILMLFLFWPVGMYLMWKHADWGKAAKIIVTVAISVIVVLYLVLVVFTTTMIVSNVAYQDATSAYVNSVPDIDISPESAAANSAVDGAHSADEFTTIISLLQTSIGDLGEGNASDIYYDAAANSLNIDVTIDGGAAAAAYLQESGTDSDLAQWTELTSGFTEASAGMREVLDMYGYTDVAGVVNLLDDTNAGNRLLSISDGEITYDVLA